MGNSDCRLSYKLIDKIMHIAPESNSSQGQSFNLVL